MVKRLSPTKEIKNNILLSILKGSNEVSQHYLKSYLGKYENPKILWYPSAGSDFKDLIELTGDRAASYGVRIIPDVFIHTDYDSRYFNMFRPNNTVYMEQGIAVSICGKYELELVYQNITYNVDERYAVFTNNAFLEPKIYLLEINLDYGNGRNQNISVLYFFFENVNFLEEVLLKNDIKISHLVKIRDGSGIGGGRKNMSLLYKLFGYLNTKYLIDDGSGIYDESILEELAIKNNLQLHDYTLEEVGKINPWSELSVTFYKVICQKNNNNP